MNAKSIFAFRAPDLGSYERQAEAAKHLGATHVIVSEDIPKAFWQLDPPGDPYPAWFIHQPGLLKIFPPEALKPYMDLGYSESVASLFEARCAVLRKLGLKGYYWTNEPQVLPEGFFAARPELRGPRVDQPNRSRKARFAPCTDRPEVLALYREAMRELLRRCPEVEIFCFMTMDSGSGLCWAPSLYPGANGNPDCASVRVDDKAIRFLMNLREAGLEAGHAVEANIVEIAPRQWMLTTFEDPVAIAKRLPEGLAVDNREGPDGRLFQSRPFGGLWWNAFYPIVGIPRPVDFIRRLSSDEERSSPRRLLCFNDWLNTELNLAVLAACAGKAPRSDFERLTVLRRIAGDQVGEASADALVECWLKIDEAELLLGALDFGPLVLMGNILARWIDRPLVPFPSELTQEEKAHYRPFLFQAKDEEQADNLIDIQAMRMFEGWGARLIVQNVVGQVVSRIDQASTLASRLSDEALSLRLRALRCLVRTADHAVSYQAQLDRLEALGEAPEPNPVLGTRGGWDRSDLWNIAREEIANAISLSGILSGTDVQVIDAAARAGEESILQLGPDLAVQIAAKIAVMNAHWGDYDRLFTRPNP